MESILAQSDESKAFTSELCFEFCTEAASLWLLRRKAVCAPHYTLTDLLELDNRLEAQIDALRVAGEPGWETAVSQTQSGRVEYLFAPFVLAFESREANRINALPEKADAAPELADAAISALGWLEWDLARPNIQEMLLSPSSMHQTIGIAASAFHRQDPGSRLENAFYSGDPELRTCGLKAVGELGGRGDKLMPGRLQDQMKSANAQTRFRAAWSALLLGDTSALEILKKFTLDPASPFRHDAMHPALRRMDLKDALALHAQLAQKPELQRQAVIAAGVIGDPALMPWLISRMSIPPLARMAGEAFTNITGIQLDAERLDGPWPEGFAAGPTDDPKDNNVEMDPDEYLPWPDAEAVAAWWEKNKTGYKTGERCLLGKPITKENLRIILQTGLQLQRTAAALELALLEPGKPLFNTAAPAWRQMPDIKPQTSPAIAPNYGSRPLAITAVNCITPLGHNAAMTAASVRAGITAFKIYENYKDKNGNPITIARIKGVRDNVKRVIERLADVAVIALKDLVTEYLETSSRPVHLHFYLGVASGDRPGPNFGKKCSGLLKSVLIKQLGNPSAEVILCGNASLHETLGKAAKTIQSEPDTLCVIGCIDSLLNASTLDWLESKNRLLSSSFGRNHSMIPAEAVGFLIVEDLEKAKKEKRPILALISSLGLSKEPYPRASDTSGICTGLSEACQTSLEALEHRNIQKVFSDLNGEHDRAREWSMTRMRCFSDDQQLPHLFNPAEYYGDIGAASGCVMACIAAQGFKRNWFAAPVMIVCSDDFGACGTVILEKEI